MSYTTANLLSLVKKKAFIPDTQNTLDDDDILELATAELKDNILPMIVSTREDFYQTSVTQTPVNSLLRIPSRAIGMGLREVKYMQGSWERDLARLNAEDQGNVTNTGYPSAFSLEGNKIRILGSSSCSIKLYYLRRPSVLVQTTAAMAITGISTDKKTLTVSTVLSTYSAATKIDIIKAEVGFEVTDEGISVESVTGTTLVFASAVSDDVAVGDWVSLEDTSPVPQIPTELFSLLAQATAVQILDSLGDMEAKASAEKKLEKMSKNSLDIITPRVSGETKSFVSPRQRGYYGWGYNGRS